MSFSFRKRRNASFVFGVTCTFITAIFSLISFVSPYWIEANDGSNLGFKRIGLWEVCFENFIFPEDYVSKPYEGCWYIYYPEYQYILFWINPAWFFAVQILSIVSLSCNLGALLLVIFIFCELFGPNERKPNVVAFLLQLIALLCFVVTTTYVGVMSKDREWLPRQDHNHLSWGFAFAVLAGMFSALCLFGIGTHYLSVQSRRRQDKDPLLNKQNLRESQMMMSHTAYQQAGSGLGLLGNESKFGAATIPSLFTMPSSGPYGYHPGSQLGGTSGVGTVNTLQPAAAAAAVGTTATSGATVSAKLRESLHAQRAAVIAASTRAGQAGSLRSIQGPGASTLYVGGDPNAAYGSLPRPNAPNVQMDSTV